MDTRPQPAPVTPRQREEVLKFFRDELARNPAAFEVSAVEDPENKTVTVQVYFSPNHATADNGRRLVEILKAVGLLAGTSLVFPIIATARAVQVGTESLVGWVQHNRECRRISPAAYLRTMWSILWSSLRSPFTVTAIDLSSGRVVEETPAHG